MFNKLSVKTKIVSIALVSVIGFGSYLLTNIYFNLINQSIVKNLQSKEMLVIMELTRLENFLQVHEMLLANAVTTYDASVIQEANKVSNDIVGSYELILEAMPELRHQIIPLLSHFNDYHMNATIYSSSYLKNGMDIIQLQPLMVQITQRSQLKKNAHEKLRTSVFNSFHDKLKLLGKGSDQQTQVGLVLGGLLLYLIYVLTKRITSTVTNSIQTAIAVSQKIAQGDLSIQEYETPQDDMKELLSSLEVMRKNILYTQKDYLIADQFNSSMGGLEPLSDIKSGTQSIRELFNSPFVGLFLASKENKLDCLYIDSLDNEHLTPTMIRNINIPLESFRKSKQTRLSLQSAQKIQFHHMLGKVDISNIDCHPILNADECVGVLVICHLSPPDSRMQRQIEQCISRLSLKVQSYIIDQHRKVLLHHLEERAQELERLNEENIKINQLKSEFLACMSHEIRTPMNGVIGMLSVMEEGDLSETHLNNINIAKECANSLLVLINDILDFSKIEAGKLSIERIDFEVMREFDLVAQSLAQQAQNKGLELILDLTEVALTHVRGDPNRLRQILLNITSNAVKFTLHGEVVIKANLIPIGPEKMLLTCSVSDTGIGIPENQLENLFEAFTQVDTSTTREFGGTGLGLAISKQLCELMGGSLSVESQLGVGSTFTLSLTFESSALATSTTPNGKIDGLHAIIVDESVANRSVMKKYLTRWGIKTYCTNNINQAIMTLKEELTENKNQNICVFIDLHILENNDFSVVKDIKKNQLFTDVRFVIMTPICEARDLQFFVNLDFDGYIRKPLTVSELQDALMQTPTSRVIKEPLRLESDPMPTGLPSYELTAHHSEKKVLLVEDNPINQRVCKKLLERSGLTVQLANTGVDALEILSADSEGLFDLVFMDCQMPEMDGYEATRQIRSGQAGEKYKNISIIAITANAMKGDREKCLAAGMNDYIPKPINRELLKEKLNQWI